MAGLQKTSLSGTEAENNIYSLPAHKAVLLRDAAHFVCHGCGLESGSNVSELTRSTFAHHPKSFLLFLSRIKKRPVG